MPVVETVESIALYLRAGTSDKVYTLAINKAPGGYHVLGANGRRGGTMTPRPQTETPVDLEEARKIYGAVVNKKLKEGYQPGGQVGAYVPPERDYIEVKGQCQLLVAIDEEEAMCRIDDDAFAAQEKHDGVRKMFIRQEKGVLVLNRKGVAAGAPLSIVNAIEQYPIGSHVDGEHVGETLYVFDCLHDGTSDQRKQPWSTREKATRTLAEAHPSPSIKVVVTARGKAAKQKLFEDVESLGGEGVVFKRDSAAYTPGRPASGGDQFKYKFWKMATLRVAARKSTKGKAVKRSVPVEIMDSTGAWVGMGNVTVKANQETPAVGELVEVKYLYAFHGGSLFQAELLRVRDDVDESACSIDQIQYKAEGTEDDDDSEN